MKTLQSLGGVDKLFQSPHFSDEGEWRSVRTDGYQTQISQLNDQGVMSTSLVIENVKQSDITGELIKNRKTINRKTVNRKTINRNATKFTTRSTKFTT